MLALQHRGWKWLPRPVRRSDSATCAWPTAVAYEMNPGIADLGVSAVALEVEARTGIRLQGDGGGVRGRAGPGAFRPARDDPLALRVRPGRLPPRAGRSTVLRE